MDEILFDGLAECLSIGHEEQGQRQIRRRLLDLSEASTDYTHIWTRELLASHFFYLHSLPFAH